MNEEKIGLQSDGLNIEGLMGASPAGQGSVVVTHPHPQYGGSMHNNVVESILRAYSRKGYCTLRFNFRGVGGSEGIYDQGIGEQADLKAAVSYMIKSEKSPVHLVGYSFGAWVNALSIESLADVEQMIMVSPPVGFMDFSFLSTNPKIRLVIAGSEDSNAPPAVIQKMLPTWNPQAVFKVIQGADHFYWGNTNQVEEIIQDFLDTGG
jgi:alpha/beta superfamily hydrolase